MHISRCVCTCTEDFRKSLLGLGDGSELREGLLCWVMYIKEPQYISPMPRPTQFWTNLEVWPVSSGGGRSKHHPFYKGDTWECGLHVEPAAFLDERPLDLDKTYLSCPQQARPAHSDLTQAGPRWLTNSTSLWAVQLPQKRRASRWATHAHFLPPNSPIRYTAR